MHPVDETRVNDIEEPAMTAMKEAVRETRDGETETESRDGASVDIEATPLDAIGHMYERAKACIAETGDWPSPVVADPCPPTKPMDVRAVRPPAPSTMSGPAPAERGADAPGRSPGTGRQPVPRRPWRRWFSPRAGTPVVAR